MKTPKGCGAKVKGVVGAKCGEHSIVLCEGCGRRARTRHYPTCSQCGVTGQPFAGICDNCYYKNLRKLDEQAQRIREATR